MDKFEGKGEAPAKRHGWFARFVVFLGNILMGARQASQIEQRKEGLLQFLLI